MIRRIWQSVARKRGVVLGGFLALVTACGGGGDGGAGPQPPGQLPLEHFDAGFFAIDKPAGWEVIVAGSCTTFAFLVRDPQDPLWQIFYFGTVGPVYLCEEQKIVDADYVAHGGFPHTWLDAPVVDPLTPSHYLEHWPEIAAMDAAGDFMAEFPALADLELVATASQAAMLPDAATGNARGLFGLDGAVGEGMFLATVKSFFPCQGIPGGGIGYGHFICGVTAPEGRFASVVDRLIASLESFSITQGYVDFCFGQQQQIWGAIAEAGQTLSEASDIIWDGWQARTHTEDISAEQWTDTYRGVERVYDPETGEVYEVPAGWYDAYDLHRGEYDMSGLQQLPGDAWELWMRAVLDGNAGIH
ncbi:MAG TPA: hypothetical protein PLL30_08610 [Candidatus Krumholzibacteria bacterium]|nr:hypothetical protein [Candidatus Krumholzibacteria bacterium]HPD71820.1 hypothetical protein [Candidatus Krumholzibacteria bacterium]HRY41247.1 hypothetical protein [Candidatus Krumholzibacteria bacterium]